MKRFFVLLMGGIFLVPVPLGAQEPDRSGTAQPAAAEQEVTKSIAAEPVAEGQKASKPIVVSQPAAEEAELRKPVTAQPEAGGPVSGPVPVMKAVETHGMITFSFKDADIRNVLRLIAAKSGVNIVYGPTVTGVVNMELKDVPWEQALSLVLDLNGYAYQKKGNVIKVLKKEDVDKEPLSTEVFVLNYATAKDVMESVKQMLTERGSIKTDTRSNAVIVTDIPAKINRIEVVLAKVDTQTPQVLIETKIVEIRNKMERDLGLKWTSLKNYTITVQDPTRTYGYERSGGEDRTDTWYTGDHSSPAYTEYRDITIDNTLSKRTSDTTDVDTYNINDHTIQDAFTRTLKNSDIRSAILTADNFNVVLSALQANTDVDLISNPRVLTANNETAQIKVVQEYPIPNYTFDTDTSTYTISGFDYKDIGVTFDVTPNISSDGHITMKIEPQVSTLLGVIPFTAGGATVNIPLIGRKLASSKLVIKSGDTLAIGGLIDEDKNTIVTKVPLLGDIPILGRLFRHDDIENVKKNIIFFITATIIDERTLDLIQQADESQVSASPEEVKKIFKTTPDEDLSAGNIGYLRSRTDPEIQSQSIKNRRPKRRPVVTNE